MAASISKNNDKAREVVRLSPLSVFTRGSGAFCVVLVRTLRGPHARRRGAGRTHVTESVNCIPLSQLDVRELTRHSPFFTRGSGQRD